MSDNEKNMGQSAPPPPPPPPARVESETFAETEKKPNGKS